MTTPVIEFDERTRAAKNVAMVVYALQAASFFTVFTTGLVGVIINYVKRDDVRGTFVETHFRWQIQTFWVSLLFSVLTGVFAITIIGIPLAWLLAVINFVWVIYRIVRGFIELNDNKPANG